jgi:hypothetical protein
VLGWGEVGFQGKGEQESCAQSRWHAKRRSVSMTQAASVENAAAARSHRTSPNDPSPTISTSWMSAGTTAGRQGALCVELSVESCWV